MKVLHGIDVSAWQGRIDWKRVKRSGLVDFAYFKATEGVAGVDDCYRANHDGAKAAGITFGAYHFLRFGQDPAAQAQHFLDTTDGLNGELLPMLDIEGGGQDGVTDLPALNRTISRFLVEIEKTLHGKRALIYTDYGDWNSATFMRGTDAFSGHPLWIAEYNEDAAPTLPSGWKSWSIWQHSSKGSIPGIAGNVDVNILNGADLSSIRR